VYATVANNAVNRRRSRSPTLLLPLALSFAPTFTLDLGASRLQFLERRLRECMNRRAAQQCQRFFVLAGTEQALGRVHDGCRLSVALALCLALTFQASCLVAGARRFCRALTGLLFETAFLFLTTALLFLTTAGFLSLGLLFREPLGFSGPPLFLTLPCRFHLGAPLRILTRARLFAPLVLQRLAPLLDALLHTRVGRRECQSLAENGERRVVLGCRPCAFQQVGECLFPALRFCLAPAILFEPLTRLVLGAGPHVGEALPQLGVLDRLDALVGPLQQHRRLVRAVRSHRALGVDEECRHFVAMTLTLGLAPAALFFEPALLLGLALLLALARLHLGTASCLVLLPAPLRLLPDALLLLGDRRADFLQCLFDERMTGAVALEQRHRCISIAVGQ
jgi:hypothetical protein